MIVVDASVLANGDDESAGTLARRRRQVAGATSTPDLVDVETVSVPCRRWSNGDLTDRRFRDAVDDLLALPITRFPTAPLMRRAFELRANVTAYDACYVARTAATADVPVVEACFTLATTGLIADTDGPVPTDSLDCKSQSSEPTVEEYEDAASSYPTIAEAATEWFTRTADERADVAGLQLVTTPYDPIANLVDAEGRSQAVIKLAGDGGTSWRVSEAAVCPAP